MTRTSTVLILGASGRLGAACTAAFADAGSQVIAQTRKPATQKLPDGVYPLVTGDSPDSRSTAKLQNVDVVVHAMNPAYTNPEIFCRLGYTPAPVPATPRRALEVFIKPT